MSTDSNERRFDILFDGSTLNGADLSEVKANLQSLFKLGDAAIERMFSGQPVSIKKNLDRKTATQYQQALTRAGAKIQLVLHRAEADQDEAARSAAEPTGASGEDFEVLPAGSDMLADNERIHTPTKVIDTDHLQVETSAGSGGRAVFDTGDTPAGPDHAIASYPAADHIELDTALSVAELGALLETSDKTPPPQQVSTDHLSLASPIETATVAAAASVVEPVADPDFSLAEAGSDLLQAHEKRPIVDADVDVSQITLSEN